MARKDVWDGEVIPSFWGVQLVWTKAMSLEIASLISQYNQEQKP